MFSVDTFRKALALADARPLLIGLLTTNQISSVDLHHAFHSIFSNLTSKTLALNHVWTCRFQYTKRPLDIDLQMPTTLRRRSRSIFMVLDSKTLALDRPPYPMLQVCFHHALKLDSGPKSVDAQHMFRYTRFLDDQDMHAMIHSI